MFHRGLYKCKGGLLKTFTNVNASSLLGGMKRATYRSIIEGRKKRGEGEA